MSEPAIAAMHLKMIRQSYSAGIRPDTRLLVSEWADLHRQLPTKSIAEPGPWRTIDVGGKKQKEQT